MTSGVCLPGDLERRRRDKQLGVVKELTDIVANAAGDPSLRERTSVLLTESWAAGSAGLGWGTSGTV